MAMGKNKRIRIWKIPANSYINNHKNSIDIVLFVEKFPHMWTFSIISLSRALSPTLCEREPSCITCNLQYNLTRMPNHKHSHTLPCYECRRLLMVFAFYMHTNIYDIHYVQILEQCGLNAIHVGLFAKA